MRPHQKDPNKSDHDEFDAGIGQGVNQQIRTLILETGSPWETALTLLEDFEDNPKAFNTRSIYEICRYLAHCGYYKNLYDFLLKRLREDISPFPWEFLLEALSRSLDPLDSKLIGMLRDVLVQNNLQNQAHSALSFAQYLPEILEWQEQFQRERRSQYLARKEQMLNEAKDLRKEQLFEGERDVLYHALELFPGDPEILDRIREFNETHALELLQRKSRPKSPLTDYLPKEEQLSQSFFDGLFLSAQKNPEIAYDLSLSALALENPKEAEKILELAPDSIEKDWLHLEILLEEGNYLALLTKLDDIKKRNLNDPDTPYALHYLKAQALYGLGQKQKAIETLESLLQARPGYRFAQSLLYLWSQE